MTQTERRLPNSAQIFEALKRDLRHVIPESLVPDFELQIKAELIEKIQRLKLEKNAVVLGHNYMEPVLFHTIPDYRGDSLELARRAATTDADIIVFCGVRFMAETAKILNPTKKVLIPSLEAGCSLTEGLTPQHMLWLRQLYPHLPIVTYINSTAEIKALSDVCCTSGNVDRVVQWAKDQWGTNSVIFLPDKYMAKNVAADLKMATYFPQSNAEIKTEEELNKEPTIIGWNSRCYVHEQYTATHVRDVRNSFPEAIVIAHPECPPEVIQAADFSGSTSQMVKFVQEHGADKQIALFTECSMGDNIAATNPKANTNLIRMCNLRCKHMNTITLEQTLDALENEQYEIEVPENIRQKAYVAVERMLAIG